ncbi:MAG: ketopantoate reductase family protein, partial [Deltaproteobacteria bacterium]|nr:ketopantoate reductase family protein [Deltaproteobacteria bacterium]MBW2051356.1 ketopantoate reductase family protein [Deltaproteobacteria bacterium]MBW2139981.1 ketopantoate reductase family protein [Deltaproteobacteria bacterium]MBW2324793.1 ketopantoate reductase family protein [Deltaproteobacteria bacterium]
MKIAVVGPGAMGCLFTAFLAKSGREVLLLDHDSERADLLKEKGLFIEGISGELKIAVPVSVSPDDAAKADLILICVKSYNTRTAAMGLAPALNTNARILTLQNGVGNAEVLSEICGQDRVWGGVTSQGATLLEPGHVRHAGSGQTIIGAVSGPGQEDHLSVVSDIFSQAGFPTTVAAEVEPLIWS